MRACAYTKEQIEANECSHTEGPPPAPAPYLSMKEAHRRPPEPRAQTADSRYSALLP